MLYFFIFLFVSFIRKSESGTFAIDYPNHQFLKDGQPFKYISGSVHYFRIHPDYWDDRLKRIRALGFNAIQFYTAWNLHEPKEGQFDFSGQLNISNFLTLAQKNDLYVLLRPSPYIDSEWEWGGLPYWLMRYDGIQTRRSDPVYLKAVHNYYNQLLPIFKPFLYKNNGPILMVQIENEYGGPRICDHNYTNFLRDLIWNEFGNDTVLYTVDHIINSSTPLVCGSVPGALPTIDFGVDGNAWADRAFSIVSNFSGGGPPVVTEFWVYVFNYWFNQNKANKNPNLVGEMITHMHNVNNASINVYLIHGGTTFGFMNGVLSNKYLITSYDYDAAIAENGDITDTYLAIHSAIQNLTNWSQPPLAIPNNNTASNYGQVTLTCVGSNLISTLTQIQEVCQGPTPMPMTFESLDYGYGYVLYTTTLTFGGNNLSAPSVDDFGYVFLNNNYQGMLMKINITSILLPNTAQPGDVLRILVENGGRTVGGSIEYKGLVASWPANFKNVTLNGAPLLNWHQCGINMTKASIDSLIAEQIPSIDAPRKAISSPGVYLGTFTANTLADTFFDSSGWGKGQLFINGYNMGRYWTEAGPQTTLYVPKPYLQTKNNVLLIELIGTQQNYVNFIDYRIWNYNKTI